MNSSLVQFPSIKQLLPKHRALVFSVFCALVLVAFKITTKAKSTVTASANHKSDTKFATKVPLPSAINAVCPEFRYQDTPPIPFRPFVGKKDFRINMGIRNLSKDPEELILMESTYKERTELRKKLCKENYDEIIDCVDNDESVALAVREYYEIITQFLLKRYPQYFKIVDVVKDKDNEHTKTLKDERSSKHIHNSITGEYLPLDISHTPPKLLLELIGNNTEEDVFILLKNEPANVNDEYRLKAYYETFPAGFNTSLNFNQPISFIHSPIPQYRERLQLAMQRFFNRLEPQHLWYRTNWSIQMHNCLFNPDHNSLHKGRPGMEDKIVPMEYDDADFDNLAFLRVERQVFTRMPKLRANIMLIRTYLTPLKEIKKEGLAEDLVKAIDGLPADLAYYKMRNYWGNAVKRFLQE